MSFAKYLFLFVITCCTAHATTYYRHIPFNLPMNADDTLVVNYDFKQQAGVHCNANQKNIYIHFYYKGSEKINILPITLLNDHLPDKKSERLADTFGQFTIRSQSSAIIPHPFIVNCEYTD